MGRKRLGTIASVTLRSHRSNQSLRGQEMHALTISKDWGPSASRSPVALGRPRRPRPPALGSLAGDVRGRAEARSATAASPGRLAGPWQARPGARGRGCCWEGSSSPRARASDARTSRHRTVGPGGWAARDCGGSRSSEARPKLAFRTSPGLTCLSRETSTVLTPVISRFRRFSSDLRSMTRRSVIFLPSAPDLKRPRLPQHR